MAWSSTYTQRPSIFLRRSDQRSTMSWRGPPADLNSYIAVPTPMTPSPDGRWVTSLTSSLMDWCRSRASVNFRSRSFASARSASERGVGPPSSPLWLRVFETNGPVAWAPACRGSAQQQQLPRLHLPLPHLQAIQVHATGQGVTVVVAAVPAHGVGAGLAPSLGQRGHALTGQVE